MKKFTFGNLSFDRNSVPDDLRDLSTWPTVDHTALPEEVRASYAKREEAMRLFVEEVSLTIREIQEKTGIQGTQLPSLRRVGRHVAPGQAAVRRARASLRVLAQPSHVMRR